MGRTERQEVGDQREQVHWRPNVTDVDTSTALKAGSAAGGGFRKAYLFTWNPTKRRVKEWSSLPNDVSDTRNGGTVRRRWSTAGSWKPQPDDRAFLLVQGDEPKGIMPTSSILTFFTNTGSPSKSESANSRVADP